MANQLTQEEINAINNYSKEIKTIESYVDAVRQMPGMYAGGTMARGYLSMIREIYQNSIDQVILQESPANWVYLYYNEITHECRVNDNGLGLPFGDIVRILTTPNTSKNYEKKKGVFSNGRHGQGGKVTNALSSRLIAESYRYDGKAVRFETKEGYPIKTKNGNPYNIPNPKKFQGTKITFWPSDVLGDIDLSWTTVYKLAKQILVRTPIGSVVDFEGVDSAGIVHKEHIVNKDGIIGDLIEHCTNPICKPITVYANNGDMKLEAAFVFDGGGKDEGPSSSETVISFCNFTPCQIGDHTSGTLDGICKWFTKYMNTIYLSNNPGPKKAAGNKKQKTLSIINSDIKTGLVLSINAAVLEPIFIGQAKEQLANPEMNPFCASAVSEALNEWSKQNPQDLAKLCKYFKDIGELRLKESGEKAKIVNKYTANVLTGYPSKYAKPLKKKKEFIIVEGDSAAGTVKKGRDVNTQGIYPIRGKISNAFRSSKTSILGNEEVQGIIKIITGQDASHYNKHFDPQLDIEWEKIILMSDGDVDGAHIASLLLRLFLLYMPQIIQAGKLYKAVPPLYSIPVGKKEEYFTANIDFVRYIQKLFVKNNDFKHMNKTPVTSKEATVFFMRNEDYIYHLERTANTFGVNPHLLEFALFEYYNKTSNSVIKKKLVKEYRFMTYEKKYNVYAYTGIIGEANDLPMSENLIKQCKPILDMIEKNNELYYLVNGKVASIYTIMKLFEKLQPSHLQRYKGLGEMDANQLAESTLLPGGQTIQMLGDGNKKIEVTGNRTLIRYTIEDVKEEIAIIRNYESDFSQLFKFVGNVSRQDLLD